METCHSSDTQFAYALAAVAATLLLRITNVAEPAAIAEHENQSRLTELSTEMLGREHSNKIEESIVQRVRLKAG
jgi:hypothetical protein